MNRSRLVGWIILVCLVLSGCGRRGVPEPGAPVTGMVTYGDAGISLTVDEGWRQVNTPPVQGASPPTLTSARGVVQVLILPKVKNEPQEAIDDLQKAYNANTQAIPDTFKVEPFKTDGGIEGLRYAYRVKAHQGDQIKEGRIHGILFHNASRRVVSVSYIATDATESEEVMKMILGSVKLLGTQL